MSSEQDLLSITRWRKLWARLDIEGSAEDDFIALARMYDHKARAYHNARHVADCLEQFDLLHWWADHPDIVEMAIWYHDAIYDPRAKDNEEQSAAIAEQNLSNAGLKSARVRRVRELIMATKHTATPNGPDEDVLLDVDLCILGRDAATFDEYDRAIRAEYDWVPEEDYRCGRAAVLQQFLNRDSIFQTPLFRQRYEATARENLSWAIARLQAGLIS